jgi:hypothetical protein
VLFLLEQALIIARLPHASNACTARGGAGDTAATERGGRAARFSPSLLGPRHGRNRKGMQSGTDFCSGRVSDRARLYSRPHAFAERRGHGPSRSFFRIGTRPNPKECAVRPVLRFPPDSMAYSTSHSLGLARRDVCEDATHTLREKHAFFGAVYLGLLQHNLTKMPESPSPLEG